MSSAALLIDIGGTATKVAIAENGRIINRAELPSYKPSLVHPNTDALCKELGSWLVNINPEYVKQRFVMLGVAGVWDEHEEQQYRKSFVDSWSTYINEDVPRCSVLSDVEIAHFAAFGNQDGTVLIAGTGSIAALRDATQRMQRCGGWGPQIDDAGSGYKVGLHAVVAVAKELDGRGQPTLLRRPVAAFFQVNADDSDALSQAIRQRSVSNVAKLAEAVLTYASEGDDVAQRIRTGAANDLCELITVLNSSYPDQTQHIALHGSLFRNADFAELVTNTLVTCNVKARVFVLGNLLDSVALQLHSSTGKT